MSIAYANVPVPAPDEDDAAVLAVLDAINDLPPESHREVELQLVRSIVTYERSGDMRPLTHFVHSLLMTARLHRTPGYMKAVADAAEDDWKDTVDMAKAIDILDGRAG